MCISPWIVFLYFSVITKHTPRDIGPCRCVSCVMAIRRTQKTRSALEMHPRMEHSPSNQAIFWWWKPCVFTRLYDNTMTIWSMPPGKMIKCRSVIAQQITMKTTEQARHTKHIVYTYIYVCCCINTDWNRLHRVAPCICISSAAVLSLSIWTHRTHGVSFRIDANSHASCPLRRLNIAHNSTQRQAQYAGAYGNCLSFCIFQMLGGPECVCVCVFLTTHQT